MTLFQEIQAKCSPEVISAGNYHVIAETVNVDRVKTTIRTGEIGNGTVLESLGLTVGNALLDLIHANPSFKYVVPLLDQGRLIINSTLVQGTLQSLVNVQIAAGVTFTQAHMDALNNASIVPDPVTWMQCQEAVEKGT